MRSITIKTANYDALINPIAFRMVKTPLGLVQ